MRFIRLAAAISKTIARVPVLLALTCFSLVCIEKPAGAQATDRSWVVSSYQDETTYWQVAYLVAEISENWYVGDSNHTIMGTLVPAFTDCDCATQGPWALAGDWVFDQQWTRVNPWDNYYYVQLFWSTRFWDYSTSACTEGPCCGTGQNVSNWHMDYYDMVETDFYMWT